MIKKLFMILGLNVLLFAHPHTFLDVYADITSTKNKIKTITFQWVFDDMTSQLLIMEFDQNGDGKLGKEEQEYVKINYFDYLDEFNYYTNLKLKNKPQKIKPQNFITFIKDSTRIVYQFDLVINEDKKDVKIEFYDKDMFTALILKKEQVKSNIKFKVSDVDNDYYFGYALEFE